MRSCVVLAFKDKDKSFFSVIEVAKTTLISVQTYYHPLVSISHHKFPFLVDASVRIEQCITESYFISLVATHDSLPKLRIGGLPERNPSVVIYLHHNHPTLLKPLLDGVLQKAAAMEPN